MDNGPRSRSESVSADDDCGSSSISDRDCPRRRRQKNRDAARRSRQKTTERADELHQELQSLEQENSRLQKEIRALKRDKDLFSSALEKHEPLCCRCPVAPPRVGRPGVGPPQLGPLLISPPGVGPRRVGPPRVGPPGVGPPQVGPPGVGPPQVGPPGVSPPVLQSVPLCHTSVGTEGQFERPFSSGPLPLEAPAPQDPLAPGPVDLALFNDLKLLLDDDWLLNVQQI
uniref:BZIP domain-containing protein n=1 Tax=Knipowitschia caucasica TaxID=637954 RepID=A0AAV2KQK9_KNICA